VVDDKTIETSVDELIALLQNVDKISISDAAKKLGVSLDVVQMWVDFLVEEKILGVEYKFTVPYIYLNKIAPDSIRVEVADKNVTLEYFKEEFGKKAARSNIVKTAQSKELVSLWRNHLINELNKRKEFFYNEATKRRLEDVDRLWNQFRADAIHD